MRIGRLHIFGYKRFTAMIYSVREQGKQEGLNISGKQIAGLLRDNALLKMQLESAGREIKRLRGGKGNRRRGGKMNRLRLKQ